MMLKQLLSLSRKSWIAIAGVALVAALAFYSAQHSVFSALNISPLILAIILGMTLGNTVYRYLPTAYLPGVKFVQQRILRIGIIFYGLQITFQDIMAVGMMGLVLNIFIVASVFLLGTWCGMRWLKLDRDTAMLTSVGSAICGAAAVLATEPVLKAENHKTALAVTTVVLFGTLAMIIYPFIFHLLEVNPDIFGIYVGATVHEVAQVVAVGESIGIEATTTGVIVKLTRVMLLAPFLLALSYYIARRSSGTSGKSSIVIPWFVLGFVAISAINSLAVIPDSVMPTLIRLDLFLLTMAMTALGLETDLRKFKTIGWKPVLLAGLLFIYLIVVGYLSMIMMISF